MMGTFYKQHVKEIEMFLKIKNNPKVLKI